MVVTGLLNIDTNVLTVSRSGVVLDVTTGEWSVVKSSLQNTTYRLVKLS